MMDNTLSQILTELVRVTAQRDALEAEVVALHQKLAALGEDTRDVLGKATATRKSKP